MFRIDGLVADSAAYRYRIIDLARRIPFLAVQQRDFVLADISSHLSAQKVVNLAEECRVRSHFHGYDELGFVVDLFRSVASEHQC